MDFGKELRDILVRAIPFVMARRKESGGFGATPLLPATVEDTYHALNVLRLARQCNVMGARETAPSGDKNLRSYLASCLQSLPAGMKTHFQLLWCCRFAEVEFERGDIDRTVISGMRISDALGDWYYCVRIVAEVLGRELRQLDRKGGNTAVLKRGWRSVDEAWMQMYLSWKFGAALPESEAELIAWLQASQNGDGGFGFFPGTTSFIENCHECLRALTFLRAKPLYPERAVRFITGCQTASGGFGRGIRTTAFLDATWHGLAALAVMNFQGR